MPDQFSFSQLDRLVANTLRMLAADAVQAANSGHPGLPLGTADIATVLWSRFLKHNPENPTWVDRDRFILSAGHGSALLYALLHVFGYPLGIEDLKQFRQWGSITPGHPEHHPSLGIEITTGPLGQGFATSVGMALAERWLASRFNREDYPLINHFTYVLASDGDLMEGVSHEAASLAGHWKLGKLIVLYDDNRISIDGPTSLSCSDDVSGRFESYGWQVLHVNGHNMEEIAAGIGDAQKETERPTIIVCRTHIGWGSPRQDSSKAHGEPLGLEDLIRTKQTLDWPLEPSFFVPNEVPLYIQTLNQCGHERNAQWNQMMDNYRTVYPELAKEWDQWQSGSLPAGWELNLPLFDPNKPIATRSASGQVINSLSRSIPILLGGSADLTPSNNTRPSDSTDILPPDYNGRYIRFGIREHAMGSIMNGLALHGLRPYGGTFLVFSDYMRPAIRLAALMNLPVIYVFTHDSIGLGEDGPTHQPVEHLASLRSIPNLNVIRPADAIETKAAWKTALTRTDGPTALILTRQALPIIVQEYHQVTRGAYVLSDPEQSVAPKLVFLATGSEVFLALDAKQVLQQCGVPARVVSMPSWELFATQSEAYKESVIPAGIPCISIEAGRTFGWGQFTGGKGVSLGLDRFGASAPAPVLFEKFGFSVDHIVYHAIKLLQNEECHIDPNCVETYLNKDNPLEF